MDANKGEMDFSVDVEGSAGMGSVTTGAVGGAGTGAMEGMDGWGVWVRDGGGDSAATSFPRDAARAASICSSSVIMSKSCRQIAHW